MKKTKKPRSIPPPKPEADAALHDVKADLRRAYLKLAAIIALLTLVVYLPSLGNGFVWMDDDGYVFQNPNIRSLNLNFLKWAFTTSSVSYWHPIPWISHALDVSIWGLNPVGHHLTALLLHAVNAALVTVLAARLIERADSSQTGTEQAGYFDQRGILVAAGVAGLLFGLHPLRVESVAWVTERKDLLCATFFLTALLFYLDYTRESGSRTRLSYGVALVSFALALMSKPMAVTFPAIILLLDYYPLRRFGTGNPAKIIAEKLPFFLLSAASVLITYLSIEKTIVAGPISYQASLLVFVRALSFYIQKTLVPLNLLPVYAMPEGEISLFSSAYFVPLVLAAVVTVLCWLYRKRAPYLAVAWLCYVIILSPSLGNSQAGVRLAAADRFTYLPVIGLLLLVGLAVAWCWTKRDCAATVKKSLAAAGVCLCLALTYATVKQIALWKDSVTLFSYFLAHEPKAVIYAYIARSLGYRDRQEYDRAIEDLNSAIRLDPQFVAAYLNRGELHAEKKEYPRALEDFSSAIRIKPDYADAYINRGVLQLTYGAIDLAIADFDRALSLDQTNFVPYFNRAIAYKRKELFAKAIEDYSKALALNPGYVDGYLARGELYVKTASVDLAVSDYKRACELGSKTGCDKALIPF